MLILIAGYVSARHVMISTALAMSWIGAGMLTLGSIFARAANAVVRRPHFLTDIRGAAVLTAD